MFDYIMTKEQIKIRDEVRELVKWTPRQMILDMDTDKIKFPKEFLQEAARRNLLGCRYPKKWGGREMDWVTTCMIMEEVGTLGYEFACVFGVGAELVCDAIILHGTDEQKEKYVKPLLKGELFAAECLTEPRGGSDFFGHFHIAKDNAAGSAAATTHETVKIFDFHTRAAVHDKTAYRVLRLCFRIRAGVNKEKIRAFGADNKTLLAIQEIIIAFIFSFSCSSKKNVVGKIQGAYAVFNTMMIPERLGTAAMTIGAARPALDIATQYTSKRKAFGQIINQFEGVSFQIAEAAMLLDAARAMAYVTARAVDLGADINRVRRMVSQSKKFITESCQKVVHNSMQVMGGIAYTNVFPIERIYRDIRLASIWTGTSEIMSMITAHEWYREYFQEKAKGKTRDHELDAPEAYDEEKIYDDDDMWKKGW